MKSSRVATWALTITLTAAAALGQQTPAMPEDPPTTWLTYHLTHPGPGGAVPADPNCAIFHKGNIMNVGHFRTAHALIDPAHNIAQQTLDVVVQFRLDFVDGQILAAR